MTIKQSIWGCPMFPFQTQFGAAPHLFLGQRAPGSLELPDHTQKQHFSSTLWLKDPFRSLNSLVQAWPNQTCRHIPTFRMAGSLHVANCNKTWPLDTFDSVWLNLVHLNCIPNV